MINAEQAQKNATDFIKESDEYKKIIHEIEVASKKGYFHIVIDDIYIESKKCLYISGFKVEYICGDESHKIGIYW